VTLPNLHGKEGVDGSSPSEGLRNLCISARFFGSADADRPLVENPAFDGGCVNWNDGMADGSESRPQPHAVHDARVDLDSAGDRLRDQRGVTKSSWPLQFVSADAQPAEETARHM
jgi:hypothetical protein